MHISHSSAVTVLVKSGNAALDLDSVAASHLSASLVALTADNSLFTSFCHWECIRSQF